jgi:hypothetical protein
MLVRRVKTHGHFRWNKHDIFLSEVLWGESVGLLPVDDGIYTVYFAHVPLTRFDSEQAKPTASPKPTTMLIRARGSGGAAPDPAIQPQKQLQMQEQMQKQILPDKENVSGICPV